MLVCAHTLLVTRDAYLLYPHILLVFHFLSPSQSTPPFFFLDKHTYTLWGDWCCKLAWVCRWSGCDYCLALRQLWWWHSVLWAPLAWARSKHNQAAQSLCLTTVHTCGLDSTVMHTCCIVLNIQLHTHVPGTREKGQIKDGGCLLCAAWGKMMTPHVFEGAMSPAVPYIHTTHSSAAAAVPQISSISLCCHCLCLYSICSKCLFAWFCQA